MIATHQDREILGRPVTSDTRWAPTGFYGGYLDRLVSWMALLDVLQDEGGIGLFGFDAFEEDVRVVECTIGFYEVVTFFGVVSYLVQVFGSECACSWESISGDMSYWRMFFFVFEFVASLFLEFSKPFGVGFGELSETFVHSFLVCVA